MRPADFVRAMDTYKEGSVGQIVDRMEVKIGSPDPERVAGEIMVRGTNVMLGYYKTRLPPSEVMAADGWMLTGDLGTIDKDGISQRTKQDDDSQFERTEYLSRRD